MAEPPVFGINKMIKKILPFISPTTFFHFLRKKSLEKKYKNNHVMIGIYSSVKNSVLGNYVFIRENVSIKNSDIGDNTIINSNAAICFSKIGKFSSIGSNVILGLSMHPSDLISTHPAFYSNNKPFKTYSDRMYFEETLKITVGNDVWIGEGALVMGGIKIGDGAIIAAKAVVTKNVEPYEIVGGVPAKTIRYRFEPEIRSKIQQTKWWNQEEKWFIENFKLLHNVDAFLKYFNLCD